MIRAIAVVFVLCLTPVSVFAQVEQLTINVASAEVRKGPSLVNPVIGRAQRGDVLVITRDVGDWYKVSWPGGQDGAGYVRKTDTVQRASAAQTRAANTTAVRAAATRTSSEGASSRGLTASEQIPAPRQLPQGRTSYIATPSHTIGVAGLIGGPVHASTIGFGGAARGWTYGPLGFQLEVMRHTLTSASEPGRVTSTHIAPSVMFSLPGALTDHMWLRPYVGAGGHLSRSTLSGAIVGTQMSDTAFGTQALAGAELTLASMPRLALSADVGYRWTPESFAGFEGSGLAASLGIHWYVR